MKTASKLTDISNHYITRIVPIKLESYLRIIYPEMKKAGLRDKFREESDNCLRAIIVFYDLAMESPRAAEIALEKLRTKELLSEREPDELKLALLEATRIARDSETIYQEQGDIFASNMKLLCVRSFSIAKEAIEQKTPTRTKPFQQHIKTTKHHRRTRHRQISILGRPSCYR